MSSLSITCANDGGEIYTQLVEWCADQNVMVERTRATKLTIVLKWEPTVYAFGVFDPLGLLANYLRGDL